ncbi:outer dense fiber protein 3-like protein 2 [Elysia marginata]|uniref:Outer dense fiber protein 3-like protein 2 n=1 Tax=Elysia marginata TaxID=1093978 RepID=A0AAV4HWG7_9GAST|nr:outer dense fiber protein 3-like protein 2 [Elysia marginata]
MTFGLGHPSLVDKIKAPGPCHYVPKVEPAGPKWAMGAKLKETKIEKSPGPARYRLKPLFPEKRSVTIGIKHAILKDKNPTPGPNEYNRDRKSLSDPGYTLQYRWFDTETERTPGPGDYMSEKKNLILPNPPAFSIKKPWPPSDSRAGLPGPGHYDVCAPPLDKGRSIGRRFQHGVSANPSPAAYCPERSDPQRRPQAPAYSLTGRHQKALHELYEYQVDKIWTYVLSKASFAKEPTPNLTKGMVAQAPVTPAHFPLVLQRARQTESRPPVYE